MSYIAPAGTWLRLSDIGAGLASGWLGRGAVPELAAELCALSGSRSAWPLVSGRAAMTVALRAIGRQAGDGRNQVIVPAYTCYSVPASVERAGLVPVPCEMDPATLSLDLDHLEKLAAGPAIAVISANLFGIPNDLPAIERSAKRHGLAMLDDAAQAMGSRIAGRPAGGFGDAGLYSFDKGKNISTIQGGALLARDGPWHAAFEAECAGLAPSAATDTALTALKLPPYALFLRPAAYGLIRRLPMLRLGETCYESRYPVTRLSRGLAGLALRQVRRLDSYRAVRVARAGELRRALDGVAGLRFVELLQAAEPAYPRFPVRAATRALRDRWLAALNGAGIGATAFYPRAIVDVPEVAARMHAPVHGFPGARSIAETILTLPTHAYCPDGLASRIRELMQRASEG